MTDYYSEGYKAAEDYYKKGGFVGLDELDASLAEMRETYSTDAEFKQYVLGVHHFNQSLIY